MTDPETDVDTAAFRSYLSRELEATVADAEGLHDGLNLSVAISTEDGGRAYVLRRPNKLRRTESFNDLREEYEVLRRLRDTAVDAPEPVLICDDESVLGDPFLVMTHLDGESVPLGSPLPERFRTPAARERVASLLIETLADLHSVDTEPFAAVCEQETAREQVERVTARLDAATAVTGRDPPRLRSVADWLERNAPSDSEMALVHGDYRPSNVLFADADRPVIAGVLDWETAFLGDPLTELGYLLLRWRDDGDPTPPLDELRARYSNDDVLRDLEETNERGLAPFTNRPGSPSRRELVARYEEATGVAFENDRFYRALAAFMLATVWEDLHRHQIEAGLESDWEPYVDYMAMIADSIASGEFPL
ncbi:phosphotransferase family protein [Halostella sp. JP-L12]|uniref:phosphotransferase family protein n=1 Tax=Halostella TaxID=1843185 RepID=UPI000EF7BAC1|nr:MULTISPECIES: phosphotransferase family protein [Halostella]NHN47962.1 phosphotransferase family protein [Halostella sp. JP-L12]